MDESLKDQLIHTFISFKRTHGKLFHPGRELFVLGVIGELAKDSGDEDIFVSNIRQRIDMSMPAVSQLLGIYEKKGYITRSISPKDRRRIAVRLTPEGEKLMAGCKERNAAVLELLIDYLGEDDTKELLRILRRIAQFTSESRFDI